jgi:diguanylate cyclase (GGDEF)-like protein
VTSEHVTLRAAFADPVVRLVALSAALWVALYAAVTWAEPAPGHGALALQDALYDAPLVAALVLNALVVRRSRGTRRRFWAFMLVANVINVAADWLWFGLSWVNPDLGMPTPADYLYLAEYALLLPALVVGFRRYVGSRLVRAIADAACLAAVAVAVMDRTLFEEVTRTGVTRVVVVAIAYVCVDVALVTLAVCLALCGERRPSPAAKLVTASFVVLAATDIAYVWAGVLHDYGIASLIDVGWVAQYGLLLLALVCAFRHGEQPAEARAVVDDPTLPLVIASFAVCCAVVIPDVAAAARLRLAVGVGCALLVVGRLVLTSREHGQVARRLDEARALQERLATTDALTGLANRRFLEDSLQREAARYPGARRLGVLVLDLDHFKRVNDTYGHPTGDRVLVLAAQRLAAVCRAGDIVARYGGEEFCMLVHGADALALGRAGERCRRAIADAAFVCDGHEIGLTISVGGACLGEHATDANGLVRVADQALYAAKRLGRNNVYVGAEPRSRRHVPLDAYEPALDFLQALADAIEENHNDGEHSRAMARWATLLAAELGLDDERTWRCATAARFHDIGKVAVPPAILAKSGPLTDAEWHVMATHVAHGSRILRLIPGLDAVADIVACHHERVDGSGYPRGVPEGAIPVEARILSVLDAWAAMRSHRPYQRARSRAAARREIADGAGRQFDAVVCATFLALEARGAFADDEARFAA